MIASYLQNGTVVPATLPELEDADGVIRFTHASATGVTLQAVVADRTGYEPLADGVSIYYLGDEPPEFDTCEAVSVQPVVVKITISTGTVWSGQEIQKDKAEQIALEIGEKVRTATSAGYVTIQDYTADPVAPLLDDGSPGAEQIARWFGQRIGWRKAIVESAPLADLEGAISMVTPL